MVGETIVENPQFGYIWWVANDSIQAARCLAARSVLNSAPVQRHGWAGPRVLAANPILRAFAYGMTAQFSPTAQLHFVCL